MLDIVSTDPLPRIAMRAEMLDPETETALFRRWHDHGDERALHRIVTAHMRLAMKVASRFRRYGADQRELVQEAGIGLMVAARKFDPDRGVRFSTYAVWWIKASIQEYVMRNWSLVRTGSTSSQKSLFFNLRRLQARISQQSSSEGIEVDSHTRRVMIAKELGVPLRDVEMMESRMAGSDLSLNATRSDDNGEGREWMDLLEDDSPRAEDTVSRSRDMARVSGWLAEALETLDARERAIVAARNLADQPRTLASLGEELGVSKERVRQIEAAALAKLRRVLQDANGSSAAQVLQD